ncbi:MAG: GNAT family N-acetyltransferase [Ignavibacteria bacterium]|nr:GNAT family N-acetyltransferase [Ignavibacteria bacterium]
MTEELRTERTLLRRYTEKDRQIFAGLFTDKEVNFYMGGEHCGTIEDAYNLFEKVFDIYKGKYQGRYFEIRGIEYDGKLIGHFELKQTDITEEDELEAVYLLDKKYWGRGLMPEILKQVNEYASRSGRKIVATINPENTKTVKALGKAGIETQKWIETPGGRTLKVVLKMQKNQKIK